ncbi:MAG: alkaline phosphatase family protein [Geminicoccaceae bacterium]
MTLPLVKKTVICVFDGLRPDRVTEDLTPNLWRFANSGTWFRESRSVFPSVTRVATTSFATGAKPGTHGIMNNAFYHPAVIPDRLLDTSSAADLRAAEAHHRGRFVEADGLGCALACSGKTFDVVHTGSAGSAYLVSHKANAYGHWTFSIHGVDHTQTPAAVEEVVDRFGPLPESALPKTEHIDYGADVLVEHVLATRRPDVALIWFCEPDTTYHYREIGSDDAVRITRRVDEQFGRILETIAAGPDADETLIVAMSDHGQIATTEHVDVEGILRDAGFSTASRPGDGVAAVVTNAIALNITLLEKDDARLDAMAEALMADPSIGHLFSRTRSPEEGVIAGTLPYGVVDIDHSRAPDLVAVLRSSVEPDQHGLPGRAASSAPIDVPLGGGLHGGLNPYEQNTVLAFGGAPASARGVIHDPADLTDIVPTILALMDVPIPESMTGAPLAAMTADERPEPVIRTLTASRGGFEQQIRLATGGARPVVLSGERIG